MESSLGALDAVQDYAKYPATTRYMPTWTLEEILAAEPLYGIGQQRATELFGRWGGVPRYVLEGANNDSAQDMLTDAIGGANLDELMKSVAQPQSMSEVRQQQRGGSRHTRCHVHINLQGLVPDFFRSRVHIAHSHSVL